MQGVVFMSLCLMVFAILVRFQLCSNQTSFDAFIAVWSIIGSCQFAYLSWMSRFDVHEDSNSLHLNRYHFTENMIINSMHSGHIPTPVLFCNILPLMATPIGMSVEVARKVSYTNLIIFAIILTNILYSSNMLGVVEDAFIDSCSDSGHHSGGQSSGSSITDSSRHSRKDINTRLFVDVLTHIMTIGAAYITCSQAAEIGSQFIKRMETDTEADAILNNILKNSIAGTACLLEIEQEELKSLACGKCGVRPRLSQARHQLLHSMRWCMSRQVMVDLASGSYQSVKKEVDISNWAFDIAACINECEVSVEQPEHHQHFHDSAIESRNMNHKETNAEKSSEHADRKLLSSQDSIDATVTVMDELMARVAVENALFNAMSHGDEKLKVKFHVQPMPEGDLLT
jgi:hypothetical protein